MSSRPPSSMFSCTFMKNRYLRMQLRTPHLLRMISTLRKAMVTVLCRPYNVLTLLNRTPIFER